MNAVHLLMRNPAPLRTLTVDSLGVRIHANGDDLAEDAAAAARQCLIDAIAAKGSASMILAAANSQIATLKAFVVMDGIDWSKVTMFHMDEYLGISGDHPASFRRFLRERVDHKVKPARFHYITGDCEEPLAECERYGGLLSAQTIDLCLLGIGENGHIAFNDPPVANFSDPHPVKLVRLDEASRRQQVGEGHFPDLNTVPQYAITLSIPSLCAARRMICVVPERRKAVAVRDTLRGPIETKCPATVLRRQSHCTLFLDAESGSLVG